MVRSWENARWRRVAMQAVLVSALGVTVALAWWVGKAHAAALNVPLGSPQTFGNRIFPLELRAPMGWKLEPYSQDDSAGIEMIEQRPRYGPPRHLKIHLEHLSSTEPLPTPEEVIEGDMGTRQAARKEKFDFLGHPGVLEHFALEELGMGRMSPPILYACTVVPGAMPIFVQVVMVGPVAFAPADVDLQKNVLKSLQPADSTHPAPEISTPVFKLKGPGAGRPAVNPPPDNDDTP